MARQALVFVFLCTFLLGILQSTESSTSCTVVLSSETVDIPVGEQRDIDEACGLVSCLQDGNVHFHQNVEDCDLSAALLGQAGKK